MSEIVNAASLQRDLINAGRELRAAIEEASQASADYVRTKHEYQVAWDGAFLDAEGTEQTRKSIANLATAEASKTHDLALERKRIARLQVDSWQSIVSAYQSIGATAREEMRFTRTGVPA